MKNEPIQARATDQPSPHGWRLDTLRPLLKKIQQQLAAPKPTPTREQDVPSGLADATSVDRQT